MTKHTNMSRSLTHITMFNAYTCQQYEHELQ